ncbi:MAG: ABC transporter ATP-binding protein [Chloroflexi bacterium]|nr:MAG: ABC transporter ATP-binding protein [Chloroflexota bacterium]
MLRIDNVHVYYGRIHALKGISLTVETGELVALIGSNGAGKSTTLKTISGLLHPREGTIFYEDRAISGLSPHEIVGLGISHCPEGRHIFGSLTVAENLRLGASRRRDREGVEQDREWVFSLFPVLKERLNQTGGTLSGGEQQMLAIARALMSRPRLLLLDEPSLGLAPLLVERIFDVILQIKQSGGTVLLVEQNAHMALEVADRAYVLETGRITLEGPAAELRADPEVERAYLGIERRNGGNA